jgi:hypothetical protein
MPVAFQRNIFGHRETAIASPLHAEAPPRRHEARFANADLVRELCNVSVDVKVSQQLADSLEAGILVA